MTEPQKYQKEVIIMKKVFALLFSVLLLLALCSVCFAEELEPPVPGDLPDEYVHTSNADSSLAISSSGNTSISIECFGKSGTTHISSVTYLEKWDGSSWGRIVINGASEIHDGTSNSYFSTSYSTTVGSGRYRATVVFTVTRNGTDETVTVYSNIVNH